MMQSESTLITKIAADPFGAVTFGFRSTEWRPGLAIRLEAPLGIQSPSINRTSGLAQITYCVRLRPERANHLRSHDFISTRTNDGRSVRLLT